MCGKCDCSPEEQERVKTVPWQPDMCNNCGRELPTTAAN